MKATKATIQERVKRVTEIRILGGSFEDIRQYASEKDPETGKQPWHVSERQLWRYIALSDEHLAVRHEEEKKKLFNLAIARREALYARAVEAGDWRAALSILKDHDELLGLYPGSLRELSDKVDEMMKVHHARKNSPQPGNFAGVPAGNGQRAPTV